MRTFITKTMFYCMNTIIRCRFKEETKNQKRKSSPEIIKARFCLSIGPMGFVCVFLTTIQFSFCLYFNNHESNVAVFSSRASHQWIGLLACVSPYLNVGTVHNPNICKLLRCAASDVSLDKRNLATMFQGFVLNSVGLPMRCTLFKECIIKGRSGVFLVNNNKKI